jgi:ankyrin repeat protein
MRLPDDEARAAEIVELFLRYGADPARRNGDGKTAADLANARGMFDIAARLTP